MAAKTLTALCGASEKRNFESNRSAGQPALHFFHGKEATPLATTRIMPLHTGMGRDVGTAISDILDYIENPDKTDGGRLITGYQCDTRIADAEFLFSKRRYQALTGRRQDSDVIAYHVRQSFKPGEVTPEEANRIGYEFAMRFLKGNNAFIVCTHIDQHHIHNHIIWNSTALTCDRKFRNFWGSTKAVRHLSDTICVEHGLSIVENPKRHGKSYNKWRGERAEPPHRELLRYAIDDVLSKKPADLEAFLKLLTEGGCEIRRRGKTLSVKLKEKERFVRLDNLGDGYCEEDLLAVILGQKEHTPRKKAAVSMPPKLNLLIDIDAKLRDGKGMGYKRWASVFNAKQLAQTMTYLQEHKLMDYRDLKEKTEAATVRYNELSAQIKAAEARMGEIAILKQQIINYAKTREVFAAYKASGYSKKYLAEHEADILLHRTAKKAFNELGLKKLPTVKSLQEEYARLLSEKKAAYADYRRARDEMRELLTIQSNVDRILGNEQCEVEKEKAQEQR